MGHIIIQHKDGTEEFIGDACAKARYEKERRLTGTNYNDGINEQLNNDMNW